MRTGLPRYLLQSLLALLAGAGMLLLLHTEGKVIHTEWLGYLLWWLPVLALTGWMARGKGAAGARPYLPLLLLALFMLLYLFSSTSGFRWFYLVRWYPAKADHLFHALMPRFVLLAACLSPLLLRPLRRPAVVLLLILIGLQVSCFVQLYDQTGGWALYRDDHPSFIFRLHEFAQTFPSLVNYNPYWNGGTIHYVGTTSGTYALGLLLWPLWKFFPIHSVYTLGIGLTFIVVVPLLAAASMKLLRASTTAAWCAAILALGVSQYFFLWMLHFGTVGASTATVFLLPVSAALYRMVVLQDRRPWVGLVLVLSMLFLLLWPPGFIMCLPLAVTALLHLRRFTRKTWLLLAVCAAAVLLLYLKPLLVVLGQGNFVLKYVFDPNDLKETHQASAWTFDMLVAGWEHLRAQLREGHPALLFLGLAGCFFFPVKTIRRWYLPTLLLFALMAGWGKFVKPNLQLERMAIPLLFLATPPAALQLARLLKSRPPALAPVRAFVLALLVISGYSVALTYGNESRSDFVGMQPEVRHLAKWVSDQVPEGSRVMFADKTVHAYGRGHVAYLPILSGREMMACDYYHFPPKYVPYIYPPAAFRSDIDKFPLFLDLYNVSTIVTYHNEWKDLLRTLPNWFAEVPPEEVGTYDYVSVFRVLKQTGPFVDATGTVEATFNRIEVHLTTFGDELVLKYNWDDKLRTEPPVEIFPYDEGDDVTLIGIRPHGQEHFTIRYRNWL